MNKEIIKNKYIKELLLYTLNNKMSVYDYFYELGNKYRNSESVDVEEFEKHNPFLTADDILLIIENENDNIIEQFATVMNKIIVLNILEDYTITDDDILYNDEKEGIENMEDNIKEIKKYITNKNKKHKKNKNTIDNIKDKGINNIIEKDDKKFDNIDKNVVDNIIDDTDTKYNDIDKYTVNNTIDDIDNNIEKDDEDLEKEVLELLNRQLNQKENIGEVTSVNLDYLEKANGFVLINEKNANRLNVYGYNADDKDNLRGKTTFENAPEFFESGYYINFMEFENNLRSEYEGLEITFTTEDGEELDYETVMDTALELSRQGGALRLGKEYKEQEINSKKDLEDMYTGEQINYKGNVLNKGLFVNRDTLVGFFSKLKIKTKAKENIDEDELSFEFKK